MARTIIVCQWLVTLAVRIFQGDHFVSHALWSAAVD
jgi:membrane-associated PAP2 superfamily phosphatase